MKKDTNTMINLDVKSNLAKLIATENITIQHNKVSTASFDVKNRVLTLPIFKEKSGDVYDMLIAHECAHALFTPYKEWENIDNQELRSYINVLEDTRIDKLIQKKFPGVVRNYMNGFDILEKKNFFGLLGKDINKDLMIIDKINIRSKSLDRLPFSFNDQDNEWLSKVDNLKTFDDVVALAKEMLDWQKKQVEQMKKLPDFDKHVIVKNYNLAEDEELEDEDFGSSSGADENDDQDDEKNDFNNFGDEQADDEKDATQSGPAEQSDEKKDEEVNQGAPTQHAKGAGGEHPETPLKAITDDTFKQNQDKLLDEKTHGFIYGNMPEPNLDSIISYKEFLNEFRTLSKNSRTYNEWLKDKFNKFKKENKKTVSYLVKEFEMKKAATAYKRASTDKTGVIDPLKLPNYKFSEDIFKRMTILPDGKNHGFIMLVDWSGSMSDCLMNTIEQLLNLVEFVRKVNIPFEVYFFTSERKWLDDDSQGYKPSFKNKHGDWIFDNFNLVNCLSHRMPKKQLDEAMMYMYHMAEYYNSHYVYHRNWSDDLNTARYDTYGVPRQFYLGNTPLNEAILFCNRLIPMFIKKYGIEKFTFITLTDGGANSCRGGITGKSKDEMYSDENYRKTPIYKFGKTSVVGQSYNITPKLLTYIKKKYDANVIGFYVIKRVKKWDIEKYIDGKDYYDRERKYQSARKQMTKDKALAVDADGYNKYFILDGKAMKVQNFNLDDATIKKGTASEFKRAFGKSMQNRLVSRVVLNKFIEEVA